MDFYDYNDFYDFFYGKLGKVKKLVVYFNGYLSEFDNIDEAQICIATIEALDRSYELQYIDKSRAGSLEIRIHFNIVAIL